MGNLSGRHAVVIGGSMAGLLAARVLSNHFEQVTVIEQDSFSDRPEARRGQPHALHLHGLLGKGLEIMTDYFPDLPQALVAEGALLVDMGQTMRWYCSGGYRARVSFKPEGIICSRPLLEWQIRRRVVALAKVAIRDGCKVKGLIADGEGHRITGVDCIQRNTAQPVRITADLIIDATGRSSRGPQWLKHLGYHAPEESQITCHIHYTTRLYHRPSEANADWTYISTNPPSGKRMGVAFPIEGNRWIVSLGGQHGEQAPTDEAEFLAYAKSLPAPDVYDIIRNSEPLSNFHPYGFPTSLRRHYESLRQFPEGYLVLGDAVCSFNPIYGQGMTSAALQAAALDHLLTVRQGELQGISQPFFRKIARVIDNSWQTAAAEDFRFPETQGKKVPGTDLINRYVTGVHRATHADPVVGEAFLKVLNMIAPPASLFHPNIMLRVLRQSLFRVRPSTSQSIAESPQTL